MTTAVNPGPACSGFDSRGSSDRAASVVRHDGLSSALVLLCHKTESGSGWRMEWHSLKECPVEAQAKRVSWKVFIALSMEPFGIVGPLPLYIRSFRGCSVRTGWGGTAKASFEFCAISTAVRVRAD